MNQDNSVDEIRPILAKFAVGVINKPKVKTSIGTDIDLSKAEQEAKSELKQLLLTKAVKVNKQKSEGEVKSPVGMKAYKKVYIETIDAIPVSEIEKLFKEGE